MVLKRQNRRTEGKQQLAYVPLELKTTGTEIEVTKERQS